MLPPPFHVGHGDEPIRIAPRRATPTFALAIGMVIAVAVGMVVIGIHLAKRSRVCVRETIAHAFVIGDRCN